MEDYRELGNKYLKQNKRRVIITVIACAIVAACLYAFLNFMCNWIMAERARVRKENDFEIQILTDDKDKIAAIVNEDFVKSAYMGKAYSWDESKDNVYANALSIDVKNPYLASYYNKYIQNTYDVKTVLNYELLWTYGIDNTSSLDLSLGYIIILIGLFISYIFAIIGVGIIKGNVELAALERIKDYGNLRCIGATKKQVKAIVFREAFVIETIGVAVGILIGYLVSIPFCYSREYPIVFHVLPIVMILITFYFDLYFTIGDSIKKVIKISPIEALRGSFRIKDKRIRNRKKNIWTILFGIEGDYAYKNIRRNNSRFIKTVIAMAIGLGTVVFITGALGLVFNYSQNIYGDIGYFQQYLEADTFTTKNDDELKTQLYSPEAVKKISNTNGIGEAKYIYKDTLFFTEESWRINHRDKEFEEKADIIGYPDNWAKFTDYSEEEWKELGEKYNQIMKDYRESGKGLVDYEAVEVIDENSKDSKALRNINYGRSLRNTQISIYGYDAEDYERYKDHLAEGTIDLSENGILLVNYAKHYLAEDIEKWDSAESIYSLPEKQNFKLTDIKLGDEITIVDPYLLDKEIQEERKNAAAYDQKMHELKDEWDRLHKDEKDKDGNPVENPYLNYCDINDASIKNDWIIESARQKLIEDGKFKTYVVEGIVDGDPNRNITEPAVIVPVDRFYKMTGKTENYYAGFQFHVNNIFSPSLTKEEFKNALHEMDIEVEGMNYTYTVAEMSDYLEEVESGVSSVKTLILVGMGIFVVVLVSALNTINAAISNLQLRKNEFAQLRAIGMTKKSLTKAVVLEGGIVWIISSIIGITMGLVIEYLLFNSVVIHIIGTKFNLTWIPIVIAMLLELAVLCGTNILCIRDMNLNVASELTRSGE